MSNYCARTLAEVLPVLRNLHDYIGGVYEGDVRMLQIETRLVLIRVEETIRETVKNEVLSPEDRINFDSAMNTILAINSGRVPFDAEILQHARDHCTTSMGNHLKRKLKKADDPEPKAKRLSKH